VETREEKEKPALAQSGKPGQKDFPLRRRVTDGFGGSKRNNNGVPSVRPKRTDGAVTLDRRGEAHRSGVAEYAILPGQPVHLFLEMLQPKCPLEIGVQHAVRKHYVRSALAN
jgi:hypothetical protein